MKPRACAVALVAMAGTLCAASVFAEESQPKPAATEGPNAMRVVVDPQTGEVRVPTTEELEAQLARERAASETAAAARAVRATVAAPAPQVLPAEKSVQRHSNGMLSVRMSQESLSLLRATTHADGSLSVEHADDVAPIVTEE
jgi:hypothetical protein